jgi:acetylornithine deacetylase/succinyl-diaminopimelate desuccinylase-like protein
MTAPDPVWLEELFSWLRIESVSADPARADEVRAAGEWVCDFVRGAGGTCELLPTAAGPPLAVGEVPASSGAVEAPTVLVYGHFDVQPPGDEGLWDSRPFQPEIRDGWIYGRGVADDKGNLYLLLKAVELLAAAGELPVTVRIACDGEEETGGSSIVDFIEADERVADACLIFDGDMPERGLAAFNVGTRGLVYFHVRARTGERDLHSGLYGGGALNAVHALLQALAAVTSLPDELRAGVAPPTEEEVAGWRELVPGSEILASEGARPADESAADEFYARTFAAPAVDVNGIHGGEPDLVKTVLPVEAHANVSIRLAPGQDAEQIAAVFERLLREAAPPGTELGIERRNESGPGLVSPDAQALTLARDAFERVLGRRPLLLRTGGTLPIVPALAARGIPTVLTGFAAPGHNMHSPNERFPLEHLVSGVDAAQATLRAFGALRDA